MRRVMSALGVLSASMLLVAGFVRPAWAEEWVDPAPDPRELKIALKKLEAKSRGLVDVDTIGRSNQGRPVWRATVGHGPRKILYVTQQHGDETVTTPGALEFLEDVGDPRGAWQRDLRGAVTLQVIVRANPDGAVQDWRYNYDPDADPEYGEAGKGYDINRYHSPALAPEDNPATEAGLIQRAYAGFAPELVVDYHMQGRYHDADGEEITSSVMWPTHPDVSGGVTDRSKQAVAVVASGMTAAGANVSQYPGGDYEGIARNAYGLRGSASVLVEYSDSQEDLGPAFEQRQIQSTRTAMTAIAQSVGNGTIDQVDPEKAEQLPPRGDPVGTTTNRTLEQDAA